MRGAIIIHGLEDARAALRAAQELRTPVVVASAPGAAGYAGAAWFDEVIRQARTEFPEAQASAILDCGDAPGFVLGALRHGLKTLRFTGPAESAARLAEIAAAHGATLLTDDIPALDLRGARDRLASCRAWLAEHAAC